MRNSCNFESCLVLRSDTPRRLLYIRVEEGTLFQSVSSLLILMAVQTTEQRWKPVGLTSAGCQSGYD